MTSQLNYIKFLLDIKDSNLEFCAFSIAMIKGVEIKIIQDVLKLDTCPQ